MDIGFGAPVSGAWATPENLAAFAAAAERGGYQSLWSFQRLLIPAGSSMDPVYQSVLDPMESLSYAAAFTSTIRLGVAIINLPFVSPGYLAKQAATVDILSGGRHDLGLGIGWMPEEFELTGADMAGRGTQAPAPVQAGGPPILLGGMARPALERVGRIADGWITSSRTDLSKVDQLIAVVKESAAAAGRDPEALRFICRGVVRAGTPVTGPDGQRVPLSGDYDQIRADTERLAGLGVTEVFYDLNWDPEIGSPDVDPVRAVARAERILEELAPDGR